MFWQAHCSTALRGVSSMNTHIHEFFRGMTAAGKKRAACAMDTDSQSPKFGYQNILQPASARASADQQSIAEGLKPVPVRYFAGNTFRYISIVCFLVCRSLWRFWFRPRPIASRQSFGLERAKSKVWLW